MLDIAQRIAIEYFIMPSLLAIVTAAIGWASFKWQQWTGQQIEEKKKRDLHQAAENAIRWAINAYLRGNLPVTEPDRNAVLNHATEYMQRTVPGALSYFKIDPTGPMMSHILAAKLPIAGLDTEKAK